MKRNLLIISISSFLAATAVTLQSMELSTGQERPRVRFERNLEQVLSNFRAKTLTREMVANLLSFNFDTLFRDFGRTNRGEIENEIRRVYRDRNASIGEIENALAGTELLIAVSEDVVPRKRAEAARKNLTERKDAVTVHMAHAAPESGSSDIIPVTGSRRDILSDTAKKGLPEGFYPDEPKDTPTRASSKWIKGGLGVGAAAGLSKLLYDYLYPGQSTTKDDEKKVIL